ncbi:FimD/PapC C-terminal domain-containing protein [Escherichia coli]
MVNRYLLSHCCDTRCKFGKSRIVGDRGELYLSGLPEKGQVTLSWGENASTKCIFNYSLSTPESESGLIEQGVTCH